MARGPIITEEVEEFIKQFKKRHETWKAWQIQKRVSQLLHKDNPSLPEGWPGLNAVQKVLAEMPDIDPQDETWSVASLERYPIDPETFPRVFALLLYRFDEYGDELTIREAKWASRLSVFDYSLVEGIGKNANPLEVLSFLSFAYAFHEIAHENPKAPLAPSHALDFLLFEAKRPNLPAEGEAAETYKGFIKLEDIITRAYNIFVKGEDNEGAHSETG
jgi:hypothetical protein